MNSVRFRPVEGRNRRVPVPFSSKDVVDRSKMVPFLAEIVAFMSKAVPLRSVMDLFLSESDSVSGCESPSYGFSCAGSDTPDETDSSLTCSSGVVASDRYTEFCCE